MINPLRHLFQTWSEEGLIETVEQAGRYVSFGVVIMGATLGMPIHSYGCDFDLRGIKLSPRQKLWVYRETYEQQEVALVKEFVEPTIPVIELGAGAGVVSTVISNQLNDGVPQIVIEANEDLLPLIRRQRKRNDASFTIQHAAYNPTCDVVSINNSGSILRSTTRETDDGMIPAVSITDLQSELDTDDFSIVADIEGAEARLFTVERNLLEDYCRQLIIEVHEQQGTDELLETFIADTAFRSRAREGDVVLAVNESI